MGTFRTIFRALVMLGTLGLLAKAWYHYGPSVEELQLMGSRAAEMAQEAWADYWQPPPADTSLANDPHLPQPPRSDMPAPFTPPSVEPPPIHSTTTAIATPSAPIQLASGESDASPSESVSAPALVPMDMPASSVGPDVSQMLEKLTQIGARDQDLKPWGNSGQLYRFACSVPLANSPSFSRHFEAVAESPETAVAKVAAEIDAWQLGRK